MYCLVIATHFSRHELQNAVSGFMTEYKEHRRARAIYKKEATS